MYSTISKQLTYALTQTSTEGRLNNITSNLVAYNIACTFNQNVGTTFFRPPFTCAGQRYIILLSIA